MILNILYVRRGPTRFKQDRNMRMLVERKNILQNVSIMKIVISLRYSFQHKYNIV